MNSGAKDLTERLQSVFKGLKGEDGVHFLANTLGQLPGGIAIADMDGTIVFVNSVFARIFGYTPDEMIGQNVGIFAQHETRPGLSEELWREVLVDGEWRGEVYPKRRNGEQFAALSHMVQLKDAAGNAAAVLSSLCEITAYKENQKLLDECQSWSKVLVDTVPLGVQELDRDQKVVYCNSAYAQMLKYAREDVIGRKASAFASDDEERGRIEHCLEDIYEREPAPAVWEGKNLTRQGEVIDIRVNWNYRRDKAGKVTGIIAVVEDVTADRQRKEMEMEWREKLDVFHDRMKRLTPRETEVMYLIAEGKPNKVVAADLGVSPRTVEIHRKRVMDKMQAGSLAELVRHLTKAEDLERQG